MIQRDTCRSTTLLAGAFLAVAALTSGASATPIFPEFSLPSTASFEEFRQSGRAARYGWRSGNSIANLEAAGAVSIRLAGGAFVRITFPGANPASEPVGEEKSTEQSIYYVGARENWHADAHFARVRYAGIYPGIDLVFLSNSNQQLEYNFEIAPRSDPPAIRIRYEGGVPSLGVHGDLRLAPGVRSSRNLVRLPSNGAPLGSA